VKKTPLQSKYLRALADLNDQLCYFLFARSELRARFDTFNVGDVGELFVKSVFAKNVYAPKINIRIFEVPSFEADNEQVTFGAYVSTSYETITGYLVEALELFQKTNSASFRQPKKRKRPTPEDTYWDTLSASACSTPPQELLLTLRYIRLRRNHFVHLAGSLTPLFNRLIQDHGDALNRYWHPTAQQLDFTASDVARFRERESIDLVMLLRIVVQRLDQHLASQLSPDGVVEFVTARLFASAPSRINSEVLRERVRRINTNLKRDFGCQDPPVDVERVAQTIGVRK
jgi:hypothetical protein